MKKLFCKILGHKYLYPEALYVGDFDGKFCERCDLHVGEYIASNVTSSNCACGLAWEHTGRHRAFSCDQKEL